MERQRCRENLFLLWNGDCCTLEIRKESVYDIFVLLASSSHLPTTVAFFCRSYWVVVWFTCITTLSKTDGSNHCTAWFIPENLRSLDSCHLKQLFAGRYFLYCFLEELQSQSWWLVRLKPGPRDLNKHDVVPLIVVQTNNQTGCKTVRFRRKWQQQ